MTVTLEQFDGGGYEVSDVVYAAPSGGPFWIRMTSLGWLSTDVDPATFAGTAEIFEACADESVRDAMGEGGEWVRYENSTALLSDPVFVSFAVSYDPGAYKSYADACQEVGCLEGAEMALRLLKGAGK